LSYSVAIMEVILNLPWIKRWGFPPIYKNRYLVGLGNGQKKWES
jgi:hypothetical protein